MAFALKFRKAFSYWSLFALETLGESIIIWQVIPPYRRLFSDEPHASESLLGLAIWLLVGSAMVQTGYWLNRPLGIRGEFRRHVLVGHLVNFVGRLNMILVGGIFAATFIIRLNVNDPSIVNAVLLLFVLFSAFLYTAELERLGAHLLGTSKSTPSRAE